MSTESLVKLPELTHPLIIELGEGEDGQPVTLTFWWRRKALSRDEYPRFKELQREEEKSRLMRINAAAIADNAALDTALAMVEGKKPKKGVAADPKEVDRYVRLYGALDKLQEDLGGIEISEDGVKVVAQQMSLVRGFLGQVERWEPKDEKELEAELAKRHQEDDAEAARQLRFTASLLDHLCTNFQFTGTDKIPATVENLEAALDQSTMESAVKGILDAMKAPLVIRGSATS